MLGPASPSSESTSAETHGSPTIFKAETGCQIKRASWRNTPSSQQKIVLRKPPVDHHQLRPILYQHLQPVVPPFRTNARQQSRPVTCRLRRSPSAMFQRKQTMTRLYQIQPSYYRHCIGSRWDLLLPCLPLHQLGQTRIPAHSSRGQQCQNVHQRLQPNQPARHHEHDYPGLKPFSTYPTAQGDHILLLSKRNNFSSLITQSDICKSFLAVNKLWFQVEKKTQNGAQYK